jgi:hypothetical protein
MDTDVEIAVGARSSTCAHMVPPASSQSAPQSAGTVTTINGLATVNANPGIM